MRVLASGLSPASGLPTDPEAVLFRLDGVAHVTAVLDAIDIDDARSGDHCLCTGYPVVQFLDGSGQAVVTLGCHHGRALRWQAWQGDATLTERSAGELCEWFAGHGCREPKDELDESRR